MVNNKVLTPQEDRGANIIVTGGASSHSAPGPNRGRTAMTIQSLLMMVSSHSVEAVCGQYVVNKYLLSSHSEGFLKLMMDEYNSAVVQGDYASTVSEPFSVYLPYFIVCKHPSNPPWSRSYMHEKASGSPFGTCQEGQNIFGQISGLSGS